MPRRASAGRAHVQFVEQRTRGVRHGVDGPVERRRVGAARQPETAGLPDVLERGGPYILLRHGVRGWRAPGLDAAAHEMKLTPAGRAAARPAADPPAGDHTRV